MKRFKHVRRKTDSDVSAMQVDPTGDWVLFSDHLNSLVQLESTVSEQLVEVGASLKNTHVVIQDAADFIKKLEKALYGEDTVANTYGATEMLTKINQLTNVDKKETLQ
jgi:hypothetical protein